MSAPAMNAFLACSGEDHGGSINQVVDAVSDIATKLQQANIDQVIRHVDALIVRLDQSVQDLQVAALRTTTSKILDDVHGSSTRLKEILEDPKLARAIADLPEITGRVRSVSTQMDELIKNGTGEAHFMPLDVSAAGAAVAD